LSWGSTKSLRHVVFGDNIREALLEKVPSLKNTVVSMQHPYIFSKVKRTSPLPGKPVSFGFLGIGNKRKRFHDFCALARRVRVSSDYEGTSAEFSLVGSLGEEFRGEEGRRMLTGENGSPLVNVAAEGGMLSRDSYAERLAGVDYAVFLHDTAEYTYVASGALLDAFAGLIPCIAIRNAFFERYFELMGDIGYLCEDLEQVYEVIIDILKNCRTARCRAQQENIRIGRRIFEPSACGGVLRAIAGDL
jgi:hypothetical protein